MSIRHLIISLYLLLFIGVGVASGVFFWQARAEYSQLKQAESDSKRRLAEAQAKLESQEKILERLRTDPAYVEKVIRLRLGYAKPDEYIFRFEP